MTPASDDFAKNLSTLRHDLRTPLTALEIVVKALTGIDPVRQKTLLQCCARVRALIDEAISASEERPTALRVGGVMSLVADIVAEKRILSPSRVFSVEEPSAVYQEALISVSPAALIAMVSNIIDNAIEATADGATISISLEVDQARLSLMVRDEGVGVPPEILAKLGHMQLTYGKERGTGLGLLSVAQLVSRYDGEWQIGSNEGRGTMVRLAFRTRSA